MPILSKGRCPLCPLHASTKSFPTRPSRFLSRCFCIYVFCISMFSICNLMLDLNLYSWLGYLHFLCILAQNCHNLETLLFKWSAFAPLLLLLPISTHTYICLYFYFQQFVFVFPPPACTKSFPTRPTRFLSRSSVLSERGGAGGCEAGVTCRSVAALEIPG